MKKIISVFVLLYLSTQFLFSQVTEPLKTGQKCPSFKLSDIKYFNKSNFSLDDMKGEFTILDFFSRGCTSCFASFPKVNKLVEKYRGKVNIILVGKDDGGPVQKQYERSRINNNLSIPVVFDSALCNRFIVDGYPFHVWIDNNGIVKALTTGDDLNENNIDQFLLGKSFLHWNRGKDEFQKNEEIIKAGKDWLYYFDGEGNKKMKIVEQDNTVKFSSLIKKWSSGMSLGGPVEILQQNNNPYFWAAPLTLDNLYAIAFFGKLAWNNAYNSVIDDNYGKILRTIQYKVSNPDKFKGTPTKGSMYVAQYYATNESIENFKLLMQSDLKRYFGYETQFIDSAVLCYKLVISDKKKLSRYLNVDPKAELKYEGDSFNYFDVKNYPWELFFINIVVGNLSNLSDHYFDETGLGSDSKVTFKLSGRMKDREGMQKELQKYGLDFVPFTKQMKVLVISDPLPEARPIMNNF